MKQFAVSYNARNFNFFVTPSTLPIQWRNVGLGSTAMSFTAKKLSDKTCDGVQI